MLNFLFKFGDKSISVSDAGVGNTSSSRTVKYLQSVNTPHLQIITIFGATVDTTYPAHWKSHNFQFIITDDIFVENFS